MTLLALSRKVVVALAEHFGFCNGAFGGEGSFGVAERGFGEGVCNSVNASTRRSVRYDWISEWEQHWRTEVARLLRQAQQNRSRGRAGDRLDETANQLPDEFANAQNASSGCNRQRRSWNKKHKQN
jgi:hypothetical protein